MPECRNADTAGIPEYRNPGITTIEKMKTENKKKREEQRRAENSRIAELKNESKIRYVENNGGLTGYEYSIN